MKYIASTTIIGSLFALFFLVAQPVSAQMMYGNGNEQGMMGYYNTAEAAASTATTTDSGDVAGAALWQKLSSGQVACNSLSQSDFATLGDYFMGNMMGSYHDQADAYMTQSLGQQGDEAMHIAMGERLSGCNPSAPYPSGVSGWYPMMGGGMMGGWGSGGYSMTGFGSGMFGYDPFSEIFTGIVWLFAIIGVVASVMWVVRRAKT